MIPPYARSSDPQVVETVWANTQGQDAFHQDALAFAEKHSSFPKPSYSQSRQGASRHLLGIRGPVIEGHGQWTKPDTRGAIKPYKNNPIESEMRRVRFVAADVPGLSSSYVGESTFAGGWLVHSPQVFAWEGVAWFKVHHPLAEDQSLGWDSGIFDHDLWTEVLGSEWLLAWNEYTAERKRIRGWAPITD